MSYFSSNYSRINYPIEAPGTKGLRNAQLGAISAITSHFTLNENEPAVVVMPTGSGKTAVLVLTPFVLRINRALVISSSVLVRGQIKTEFETLSTLKNSNVFHRDLNSPNVCEIKSPIKSIEEWNALEEFEVVIGIPNSLGAGIREGILPPHDLFDLILVDEAHHVPASTWTETVSAFEPSKKVFFTATPFRRDKKEIQGKIAYNYPLSKAYEDKIFGDVGYISVSDFQIGNEDLAIAKKTESVFDEDRKSNLDHYLIVRTDSKDHADELEVLYSEQTKLNLKKVHSRLSYNTIQKTIMELRNKDLDGIICVNMLGEGFDFPNLKIAAIHAPQKSLAATLQFIGRFARTNSDSIGSAKFVALEHEIRLSTHRLYKEGAIWNEILKDLSEQRIEQEDNTKEVLDTFDEIEDNETADNISLYNLAPYCHVKIYKVQDFDIQGSIEFRNHEIVNHFISEEENTILFITRETTKPKWINSDELVNTQHYVFLFYYDERTKLLFIHSSIKTPQFYDYLVEGICGGFERIPKSKIHKVLSDLQNTRIFNLGLQNRSAGGESYLTKAGTDTGNTITPSDARLYSNGHIFGTAESNGELITIGYSSGAKVWSNAYLQIPQYIKWCKLLGSKITSNAVVKTNSGFDNIPVPTAITELPEDALPYYVLWNDIVFSDTASIQVMDQGETISTHSLHEVDLVVSINESNKKIIHFDLVSEEAVIPFFLDIEKGFFYKEEDGNNIIICVDSVAECDLCEFLDEYPPVFHLTDFSTLVNQNELIESPTENNLHYDASNIIELDWQSLGIDVTKEFGETENSTSLSIHEGLSNYLDDEKSSLLIYDHGTGEIADFVRIINESNRILIELYHIKASGGDKPGDRVNDVYEVCGQACKSLIWTKNKSVFVDKILNRTSNQPNKFIKGNISQFEATLVQQKPIRFSIIVVQPGVSRNCLTEKLSNVIGSADDFVRRSGNNEKLGFIGS